MADPKCVMQRKINRTPFLQTENIHQTDDTELNYFKGIWWRLEGVSTVEEFKEWEKKNRYKFRKLKELGCKEKQKTKTKKNEDNPPPTLQKQKWGSS